MQESSVIRILDDNAKHGVSAKTGKGWSMSRVELQNGESVFMFNPIEIGQVVEAVKDGDFTNWRAKRPDPKHDEIMKALRAIYAAVTTGTVPEEPKPVKDTVHPVDEAETTSDVPFFRI